MVGEELRQRRLAAGIQTQAELARLLLVNASYVSLLEADRRPIAKKIACLIRDLLPEHTERRA